MKAVTHVSRGRALVVAFVASSAACVLLVWQTGMLTLAFARPQAVNAPVCATGNRTQLRLGGSPASGIHGGSQGQALFVLEDRKSGASLWRAQPAGQGECLGFNARRGVYVVGIRKEQGIGTRLTDVWYVDEATRRRRDSALKRRELEAFAAVPSTTLRYVALIAIEGNDTALYLLDIERDVISKLGAAPLPPPLTEAERAYVKKQPDALEGTWEWMASLRDGYMTLDPAIVVFESDDILRVSYGRDTRDGRATSREIVRWNTATRQRTGVGN